ncbi:hypothetical protein Aoc01nite_16610 [Actinoplanes octamycinicus]|nr:hypothetical protein Aoc01nite_16610 [Actinoplanes octamycinicus]
MEGALVWITRHRVGAGHRASGQQSQGSLSTAERPLRVSRERENGRWFGSGWVRRVSDVLGTSGSHPRGGARWRFGSDWVRRVSDVLGTSGSHPGVGAGWRFGSGWGWSCARCVEAPVRATRGGERAAVPSGSGWVVQVS